ncbi:MAG TPA: carboxypeptidase regulatory-like domain-containing protein [Candidatus Sulfotelmatobacter sp.]|nr:carboxypeptidase regulatory-like domain-containing protein [Candidatus Sulfotelmatobacter sp.]
MICFRTIAPSPTHARAVTCLLLASQFVFASLKAQTPSSLASATLHGIVRDAHGPPVAAATVSLRSEDGTRVITTHTDSQGGYDFSAVPQGTYTLRAEMAGYRAATLSSVVLAERQDKQIDLQLEPAGTAASQSPSNASPEFFDEPRFTVAGVTDTTSLGGHGSDTVVRTRDALAKETAALGASSPGISSPASSHPPSLPAASAVATERTLRAAAEHHPESFDANHNLGRLLLENGRGREAMPYLERAFRLNSGDYGNAYELALARCATGDYERARAEAQALLAHQDRAELHHLLAEIDEKTGNPLEAVREYQRTAELDSSEPNLFDWGTELLLHRAPEPAIEVFQKGTRLFPRSVRMLVSLGVAWYAHGSYDEAAHRLSEAADLSPADSVPYLFLGKIQSVETSPSDAVAERLARFARLQPKNAMASYYYAVSLWKRRGSPEDNSNLAQIQSLLENAVRLDPKLGVAYFQLGVLLSDRNDLPAAISAYQQAIEASPQLEEPYFRLAQAYRLTGEKSKAQAEMQLYREIAKASAGQVERERHDIKQFVYTLRNEPAAP